MVQQEYYPEESKEQYTEFIEFCVQIETTKKIIGAFKTQKKNKKNLKKFSKKQKITIFKSDSNKRQKIETKTKYCPLYNILNHNISEYKIILEKTKQIRSGYNLANRKKSTQGL